MFDFLKHLKRGADLRATITAEFGRLGLDYATFDPIIRETIEMAAASSGNVRREVDGLIRVARMADQYDLSDDMKRHVIAKAYERYAERLGSLGHDRTDVRSRETVEESTA